MQTLRIINIGNVLEKKNNRERASGMGLLVGAATAGKLLLAPDCSNAMNHSLKGIHKYTDRAILDGRCVLWKTDCLYPCPTHTIFQLMMSTTPLTPFHVSL